MGVDISRVVGVESEKGESRGTGYLVGGGLVLVSAHVVSDEPVHMVRLLDTDDWHRCGVLWRGTGPVDAALLAFDDPEADPSSASAPPRWGTLSGTLPMQCTVTGLTVAARAARHLRGEIDPEAVPSDSDWGIRLDSSGGPAAAHDVSGLLGLSGAPVFTGDLLVGVVSHTTTEGLLFAVRVSMLGRSEEFVRLVGDHTGVPFLIESAELEDVVDPPRPRRRVGGPSALLAADVAAVPFHGREAELTALEQWSQEQRSAVGTADVGVYVWTAPAGYGKTRLALEFASLMATRGWAAGSLRVGVDADGLRALAGLRVPVLLVIDYGETRPEQIDAVIEQAVRDPTAHPVRVLILARSLGAWWTGLGRHAGADVRSVYQHATVSRLPVLDGTRAAQEASYRAAMQAFAQLLRQIPGYADKSWDAVAVPGNVPADIGGEGSDSVLLLHSAALATLLSAFPDTTEAARSVRDLLAARRTEPGSGTGQPASGTTPRAGAPDTEGSLRIRGFGDRAAEADLLGRAAVVAAVTDLLVIPEDPQGPSVAGSDTSGPTVVALEGPWGSGKTTMMRLIEQELGRRQKPPPPPKTSRSSWKRHSPAHLSAWAALRRLSPRFAAGSRSSGGGQEAGAPTPVIAHFNPWAHQSSEQIWAGLTRSIVEAAQPRLGVDGRSREEYWLLRNGGRLDRRHLRRTLWRNLASPLLRIAVFALLAPLVAQLVKADQAYTVWGAEFTAPTLALLLPGTLLLLGLLHTLARLFMGRARGFLPGDLFDGPVLSGPLAPSTGSVDTALRDPYYNARSGYLYLVQHDIRELLASLRDRGHELIMFIDDLDRCSPRATADVFEAINLFLSGAIHGSRPAEETRDHPRCRFVIGLDPTVVAAHLDRAYQDLTPAKSTPGNGDPTWGWTFLRKLIQLPVHLPPITDSGITTVLTGLLGTVVTRQPSAASPRGRATAPRAVSATAVTPETAVGAGRAGAPRIRYDPRAEARARALETNPDIRALIEQRLNDHPDVSIREAKRLLTIWQFYLRVSGHKTRGTDQLSVEQALHLVVLAEIAARWPAMQAQLRRPVDGKPGLYWLARSVHDDEQWAVSRARAGLRAKHHTTACDALRVLLRDHDGERVAAVAEGV
ncbi:P-loop NTPase fold protein [Streptomyces venezuelae]|uniref:P-loop NTPase fold protein n=1 Tax=Streptomyces venezuelae TaxID=54571 RepID=UPI003451830D